MKKGKVIFLIFATIVILVLIVLFIARSANQESSVLNAKKDIKREQNKEKVVKMDKNKNSSQPGEKKYVEGQILVKFKAGLSQEDINKFLSDYGLKKMEIIQGINVYKLALPPGKTVQDVLKLIQKDQRIEYAEPNYLFKLNL